MKKGLVFLSFLFVVLLSGCSPKIELDIIENTQIIYVENLNDRMDVYQLDLFMGDQLIESTTIVDGYSFTDLYSNTEFRLVVYYYGVFHSEQTYEQMVHTKAFYTPIIEFDSIETYDTFFRFETYVYHDLRFIEELYYEVYLGDELIEELSLEDTFVTGLETNNVYTFRAYFTYDLLDGNGIQTGYTDIPVTLYDNSIRYFLEIALGSEYGDQTKEIKKWEDDIIVYVTGDPSLELRAYLDDVLDYMYETINHEIHFLTTDIEEEANVSLYFGKASVFNEEILPTPNSNVLTAWGFFSVYSNSENVNYVGYVFVDTYYNTDLEYQKAVLLEEMTQALGLGNDSYRYEDSVFQQTKEYAIQQYSEIDQDVIYMLYHPSVIPGMSEEELLPILMEIRKEMETE
jgi:hypothetical protein